MAHDMVMTNARSPLIAGVLAATIAALCPASGAHAQSRVQPLLASIPAPAIVLLWASWCAPCQAELRALPTLTSAVVVPVVVIAVDADLRTERQLANVPAASKRFWRSSAWSLTSALGLDIAGLPAAFALDRHGRVCGTLAGGVNPARLRALVAGCQPNR